MHRLDKETSGAILFAKNPFILPILNRILEDKNIQREYWALIQSSLAQKTIVYKDKIGRDRHDRRKRLVDPRKGQYAETQVTQLKKIGRNSLVKCQLKTGRTHQIRVHMAYIGHPVAGDPLYGPRKTLKGHGQFLHAQTLGFIHPKTGETMVFTAEAPAIFQETLEKLRQKQQ